MTFFKKLLIETKKFKVDREAMKQWYDSLDSYLWKFPKRLPNGPLYSPVLQTLQQKFIFDGYKATIQWETNNIKRKYFGDSVEIAADKKPVRVPHGYGICVSDSSYIKGQWANGRPNGYTEYNTKNGDSYKGFVVDSKPHGYGVYKYHDGTKYTGKFSNGVRSGKGTYEWPNGDNYVGDWLDNQKNGKGVYTYKEDGTVERGLFKDDEYIGNDPDIKLKSIPGVKKDLKNDKTSKVDIKDKKPDTVNPPEVSTKTVDDKVNDTDWFKYGPDTVYVYQQRDGDWWAKNVNTQKEYNISKKPKYQISVDRLNTAKTDNTLTKV